MGKRDTGMKSVTWVLPKPTEVTLSCTENKIFFSSNICDRETFHMKCGSSHEFKFVHRMERI